MQSEAENARSYQLKSLEFWESLGESGINGKAYSHQSLGMIAELTNDHEKAVEEYQTSIELSFVSLSEVGAGAIYVL